MKWLDDKPNLDNLTMCIRKRNKKGDNDGFSLSVSKSFKDYIKETGSTHIRFGWDRNELSETVLVLQLNKEELGLPLINDKGKIRLWFDVTSYYNQYLEHGVEIPLDKDLQLAVKKNGNLESVLPVLEKVVVTV